MGYYQDCAIAKPEPRKRTKARRARQKLTNVHLIREYVFGRERDLCRCSIAVCGSGTSLCHGMLQQYQIVWDMDPEIGAEGQIVFTPKTAIAAEHLRIAVGASLLSPPMRETEQP